MTTPLQLDRWWLDVDADGEPVLIGCLPDGKLHRSAPIATSIDAPLLVTTSDGMAYTLGEPHSAVEKHPWSLPRHVAAERLRRAAAAVERLTAGEHPDPEELAQAPCLTGWALEAGPNPCFIGVVTGHPRIPDGWIHTSPVVWISADKTYARTVSRLYRLGPRLFDLHPRRESEPDDGTDLETEPH